ncbi:hypothetical protein JTE90_020872 [Oedothorax gibbosus]|uniref:Nuclear protein MDM1 n=1 Tax=Oedothorax gibbosus TaxID=931172 RepID=A0AAV6USF0_9ARAC|nr:hypothetical protein JTE90_020872 [Oedothorax gibbosus]
MPKEEKLNSEYKRNYVWHQQYKPLAQDVINCAPQSVFKEAGIQRRKQYPELAYRNHEVIRHDLGQCSKDTVDFRARSEERDASLATRSGPRSRSAEPGFSRQQQKMMVQSFPPVTSGRVSTLPKTEEYPNISEQPSEETEYKAQFAWPQKTECEPSGLPRKSVSMNVIRSSEVDASVPKSKLAPVHRPCAKQKECAQEGKKKIKTEYKAKYKPFTSYVYVDGEWKKTSRLLKVPEKVEDESVEPWFVEVAERVQKANEYRWRGHGHPVYGELLPDIYKQPPADILQRPKRLPSELKLNLPKCHQSSAKKNEVKKKDSLSETAAVEKKPKEVKKQSLRRPKSAEPAKAKETVKYRRPATTPPAKLSSHSLPTKKRMPKVEEVEKAPPKSKTGKKEEIPRPSSSVKKSQAPPTSQSSVGKVWLQSEKHAPSGVDQDNTGPPKERSDAVRPSSLAPISSVGAHNETRESEVKENSGLAEIEEIMSNVPPSVVPLTHVRTPEEVTGVKSPEPENWTVPIDNSESLEWSGANTSDLPSKVKTPEETKEKLNREVVATEEPAPNVDGSQESSSSAGSSKLTSSNVLDRARSRLDQFWGKNK